MLIKSAYDIKSVTFSVKDQDFTPVNWWLLFNIWNLKKKKGLKWTKWTNIKCIVIYSRINRWNFCFKLDIHELETTKDEKSLYMLSDYKMTRIQNTILLWKEQRQCVGTSVRHILQQVMQHWAHSWQVSSEKHFTFLDIHGQERHNQTSTDR